MTENDRRRMEGRHRKVDDSMKRRGKGEDKVNEKIVHRNES